VGFLRIKGLLKICVESNGGIGLDRMTSASHDRKHGDKPSHPIPLWNGVFEHYARIGGALWEFVWCLDKITVERDGVGLVLGGAPVKTERIVRELKGSDKETVRRHMERLEAGNFIRRRRTPYGFVIEVLNSRKFGIWKREEKPQNDDSPSERNRKKQFQTGRETTKSSFQKPLFVVYKEDSARNTAVRDAAAGPLAACELWKLIGILPEKLPPAFRELCEGLYPTRNGEPLSVFLGLCMDGWAATGQKRYPPEFAKAKARIVALEREKAPSVHQGGLSYLEPMPPLPCK
jgi:hypothetical protein